MVGVGGVVENTVAENTVVDDSSVVVARLVGVGHGAGCCSSSTSDPESHCSVGGIAGTDSGVAIVPPPAAAAAADSAVVNIRDGTMPS